MSTKVLLVDGDASTLTWLKSKMVSVGFDVETTNTGQQAIQLIATLTPTVVVLESALPDMDGLDIVRRISKNPVNARPWIVVFGIKNQPEDIAAAYDAGADDFISKRPGADAELIGKIRGHISQIRKSPFVIEKKRGHLFAFCSPKGGTGTTSICVNVAYALAHLQPNARVLVVDMVFPLGTIGTSLGYESKRTIARLTQEMKSEGDRALADRFVSTPLKWGFRVLLGSNDPHESSALDVSRILPIFTTLSEMFDYILVDFGRTLSRISLPIIEASENVFLIVTPDIATVKGAKVFLDYLISREVSIDRVFLVNNRTVGRVWTTTEDIENELKIKVSATIPYVVEYMTMAINAGMPFMEKFPDHAASSMFRQIAQEMNRQIK
jgi:pilus assembly protein CpaE